MFLHEEYKIPVETARFIFGFIISNFAIPIGSAALGKGEMK